MIAIQKNENYDINKSAEYIKIQYLGLRKKTIEIVKHLYWAKEYYSNQGARNDLARNRTKLNSFKDYLFYVGIAKQTVYDWLERYEPKKQILLTLDEVKQEKIAKEVIQKNKILNYKKTGKKPADWTRADDYQYKKYHDNKVRIKKVDNLKKKLANEIADREKRKTQEQANEKILDNTIQKALEIEKQRNEMYKKFETDGSLANVFDIINIYLVRFKDKNRRIEACQNIIKFCRNKASEYQRN